MKTIFTRLHIVVGWLLVNDLLAQAQTPTTLRDHIQGAWGCGKIEYSRADQKISDGEMGDYLKFTFERNTLFVSYAPFDKGLKKPIVFKGEAFYIIDEYKDRIEYRVDSIAANQMRVSTTLESGVVQHYHFRKIEGNLQGQEAMQHHYPITLEIHNINNKYTRPSPLATPGKLYRYTITRDPKNYHLCPVFQAPGSQTLGGYVLSRFDDELVRESTGAYSEVVIQVDVTKNSGTQIKLIRGSTFTMNGHIFDIFLKSARYWGLPEGNQEAYTMTFSIFVVNMSRN